MALDPQQIENLGEKLHRALIERRTIAPIRELSPGVTVEDGYKIQEQMIARRLETGVTVIGKKIGVTSKAVQDLMGVYEPDFGQLTSDMLLANGMNVPSDMLIQPRIEGEIAFILRDDLVGPGITATDVLSATSHVTPCFEIVDSRIAEWNIQIEDTIADNASCGAFVLGEERVDPRDLDLALVGMAIEKNGGLCAVGAGAAVQGSPVNAVVWLANRLGALGVPFKAGEIILSGSLAGLVPVEAGDHIVAEFGGLGRCEVRFS